MISAKVAIIIYTTRKTRIEMTNMNSILILYRKRIHHPANGGLRPLQNYFQDVLYKLRPLQNYFQDVLYKLLLFSNFAL